MTVSDCDHNILIQMPENLLFDIFKPRSGDGISTDGVNEPLPIRGL